MPRPAPLLHLCLLALLLACLPAFAAGAPVTLGVLAFRPKPDTLALWQPTADYLAARTGRRFLLQAMTYPELEAAIRQRQVDFVLTNPAHYVLMNRRNGLSSPLATLIELDHGLPLTQFGGVIFTRAGRTDLAGLADLKGKTVATPDTGSLGGYQMQAHTLLQAGLSVPDDCRLLVTGMPHDKVLHAVLEGRADAGFVRTGLIEALARDGRLDPARIKVLNHRQPPGFPHLLSTRLYPEWPIAALPEVDDGLAQEVAKALFSLRADHPAARAGQYHGWAIPADYEPIRQLLQELRLPPFDEAPAFTLQDIVAKHRPSIATGLAAAAIILALIFRLATRNRQLVLKERDLAASGALARQQSEERRQLLAALGEGVYGVDPDGHCTFVNAAALAMLGYREEELLGRDQHALFHHHHADGRAYGHADCPVFQTLQDGQLRRLEEWFHRKDGSGFPVEMTAAPTERDGVRTGAVVVFHDIGARKRMEAELKELASTDPLTGLPNRRQFLAALDRETARVRRFGTPPAALLMLDLDHFKQVNDSRGHGAGDAVLQHFAELVRAGLRRTDLAGRLGGEEFAILLHGSNLADAAEFAERLRRRVEARLATVDGMAVNVTVSIGLAALGTEDDANTALARADAALYRAKANGRNRLEAA